MNAGSASAAPASLSRSCSSARNPTASASARNTFTCEKYSDAPR